jgi:hypothetical protein
LAERTPQIRYILRELRHRIHRGVKNLELLSRLGEELFSKSSFLLILFAFAQASRSARKYFVPL